LASAQVNCVVDDAHKHEQRGGQQQTDRQVALNANDVRVQLPRIARTASTATVDRKMAIPPPRGISWW
jgi:hypothetical protein